MIKRLKRLLTITSAFILTLIVVFPAMSALAVDNSLQIVYKDENTAIANAKFRAYQVTSPYEYGKFNFIEPFTNCNVTLKSQMTNAESSVTAQQLKNYVTTNKITASFSGSTDSKGVLTFSSLNPGVYLIDGDVLKKNTTTYTPQTFCVVVDNNNISVEPKFSKYTPAVTTTTPSKPEKTTKKNTIDDNKNNNKKQVEQTNYSPSTGDVLRQQTPLILSIAVFILLSVIFIILGIHENKKHNNNKNGNIG